MKQKQSVILLEAILSIALFFIVLSVTTGVLFTFQEKSKRVNMQSAALLSLESTKQFLVNNKNLAQLSYVENTLFYQGEILLKDVSKFNLGINQKYSTIDICIDSNKVCSQWKIKN